MEYEISDDKSRLDINTIHHFLAHSYWAEQIPIEIVEKAIAGSLCFGVYNSNELVGFARVITDAATFGYLADVFILEQHRGKGLSKLLMQQIMAHPDLQNLRRFCLATSDAHQLYTQFGFTSLTAPETMMEIRVADIYKNMLNS
ncbi:GNAT family N-acetyltransferase [Pseudoalteromonas shioyasakiensis]|uniref:GNAT family N-acetyltransferase n=1 Tax=Pseudoalteromonas shioyasakiensis TaxID=1190813 RepID=UPI00211891EB|nr:GNAT family N-acetyltransferase [Pseudoalteromonas shioyasakiensis]MCQ8878568.1 GNAT family N-acetyltransferase [Pseudoalteromonas shioyasakiensis]